MDPKLMVCLTPKGVDEVRNRTCRLHIKRRSILLLLERPQPLQFLFDKGLLPRDALINELATLGSDGFIQVASPAGEAVPVAAMPRPAPKADGQAFVIELHPDIILSEARFLLINFCVDVFATKAQVYVDALGLCKSVGQFSNCARQIQELAGGQYPAALATLREVIEEINRTAE